MTRDRNYMDISTLFSAEILEVSDKSISKWELGKTYPSKKILLKSLSY